MTNIKDIRARFPIYHPNWLNRLDIIDEIESAAENYATGRLLDVGCGIKPYKQLFVNQIITYWGLDISWPHCSAGDDGPDILASALRMPLPDNFFDTVITFQVLEHVPDPQAMFSEIARVLRPEGYLILLAPQMWHLHNVPHDYFRYTRYGLAELAKRAGLKVVDIRPVSGFWIRAGLVSSYHINQNLVGGNLGNTKTIKLIKNLMIIISNVLFYTINRLFPKITDPINNLLIARKCP